MDKKSFREFTDRLNNSPWQGSIREVGMGLPFQAAYLGNPGASKTILFTHTPYHKAFQVEGFRSVSKEAVEETALLDYNKILSTGEFDNNIFSLTLSASHKMTGDTGLSHGWIALRGKTDGYNDNFDKNLYVHYRVNKNMDRQEAGSAYLGLIAWMFDVTLLNIFEGWEDAFNALEDYVDNRIHIDIVESPTNPIPIETHLRLARTNNFLLYHQGKFHRVASYLRKSDEIYRGSFNPVHNFHLSVGKDSILEIDIFNARKGYAELSDVAHRLRMLDLCNLPVIISNGYPYFADFHKGLANNFHTEKLKYIVGSDTFNAIVAPKNIPHDNYLEDFYWGGSGSFIVLERPEYEISCNKETTAISFCIIDEKDGADASSTEARSGKFEILPSKVKQYILDNNLYSS